jgi:hypothetical protein
MPASTKSTRRTRAPAPQAPPQPGRFDALLAFGICVVLAFAWTLTLSDARAWGWDESMHAELPAARILLSVQSGDFAGAHTALLDCQQYPFVWPLVLALVQAVTGISEHACRIAGTLAWCATLFGLFLLGRELGARVEPKLRGARFLPWALLALGALSPLALAYAGTLFLEVPFACMAVWALRAWIRRDGTATRELAAGEWIALALFTKWNYGLLLCGGLALAWYFEGFAARRELGKYVGRTIVLVLVPLLACVWWFVLARGEEHRAVLLAFLQGNRDGAAHSQAERWMHAALSLHLGPLVLGCVLLLALVALVRLRSAPVRVLFFVALAFVVPSWTHPFHLDRFLVPQALPVWALAAVGFALLALPLRLAAIALVALGCTGLGRESFAARMGYLSEVPATREYQRGIYESWRDLSGARALPTHGLDRVVHDALAAAIVREAGPHDRVSWIGMLNEFPPAAMHLARLAAGMDENLFLSEATRKLDLDYFGPGSAQPDESAIRGLAQQSDLILFTSPSDLRPNGDRLSFSKADEWLQQGLDWEACEIARTLVARPLPPPLELSLFACRPKP